MTALVMVESIFGNTRQIAEAIAEGLAAHMQVRVVDVGAAPKRVDDTVELLVVGGPTHAFSLTRQSTRDQAAQQAGGSAVAAQVGLREWLGGLAPGSAAVATFDTKIASPWLPGSAAAAARKRLSRLGYRMVARPQNFRVVGSQGPLVHGEEERARSWGESLATQLAGHRTR
jgi:hypothetical protein